jgi:hypothetical protein
VRSVVALEDDDGLALLLPPRNVRCATAAVRLQSRCKGEEKEAWALQADRRTKGLVAHCEPPTFRTCIQLHSSLPASLPCVLSPWHAWAATLPGVMCKSLRTTMTSLKEANGAGSMRGARAAAGAALDAGAAAGTLAALPLPPPPSQPRSNTQFAARSAGSSGPVPVAASAARHTSFSNPNARSASRALLLLLLLVGTGGGSAFVSWIDVDFASGAGGATVPLLPSPPPYSPACNRSASALLGVAGNFRSSVTPPTAACASCASVRPARYASPPPRSSTDSSAMRASEQARRRSRGSTSNWGT